MSRRVVITGLGVLSGYGRGTAALWSGLESGASAVHPHRARLGRRNWLDFHMATLNGALPELAGKLPNQGLIAHERLDRDPDLMAIADCVAQAIDDAALDFAPDVNDVGLIVTHESPGLADHVQGFFRWGEALRAWLHSPDRFNPQEFLYKLKRESIYRLHSFLYVHFLSAIFQVHGFSLYNNNACASGAFALAVGVDRIRNGDASAVIVVGGDVPEDGTKYRWFRDLGLYSTSGRCRPFHVERDGLVLGSGAAALVLEDLDRAQARGARIYGEWLGGGFTSEGWKVTLPDVTSGRYGDAIERAMTRAGVTPDAISLVVPHGVGTGLFDRFEAQSLARVFPPDAATGPPLMAVKAAVGHTLGGCALMETVAALVALERGRVPELVHAASIDPKLPLAPSRGPELPRDWTLLKCTNGFAGQNGAIVLRAARD